MKDNVLRDYQLNIQQMYAQILSVNYNKNTHKICFYITSHID